MVTVTLHVNNLNLPFECMLICKHKKKYREHMRNLEPRKEVQIFTEREGYMVSRVGEYWDGNNKQPNAIMKDFFSSDLMLKFCTSYFKFKTSVLEGFCILYVGVIFWLWNLPIFPSNLTRRDCTKVCGNKISSWI